VEVAGDYAAIILCGYGSPRQSTDQDVMALLKRLKKENIAGLGSGFAAPQTAAGSSRKSFSI